MGSESLGSGSDVSGFSNDSPQPTANSSQSGGVEIQPLSDSGKGGQEGSNGHNGHSVLIEGLSKEASFFETSGSGWIVAQLTEAAEIVTAPEVERDLRRFVDTPETRYYFPATLRNGSFDKANPYANYVFITSALSDSKVLKLEGSRFVSNVLCVPGSAGRWRVVSKLPDETVKNTSIVAETDMIPPGTEVRVVSGEWVGLEGSLIGTFGDQVKVSLQLRSRRRILVLSKEEIEPL